MSFASAATPSSGIPITPVLRELLLDYWAIYRW